MATVEIAPVDHEDVEEKWIVRVGYNWFPFTKAEEAVEFARTFMVPVAQAPKPSELEIYKVELRAKVKAKVDRWRDKREPLERYSYDCRRLDAAIYAGQIILEMIDGRG